MFIKIFYTEIRVYIYILNYINIVTYIRFITGNIIIQIEFLGKFARKNNFKLPAKKLWVLTFLTVFFRKLIRICACVDI